MQGPSTAPKGPKKVPKAGLRPSFVLGSRPLSMRSPAVGGAAGQSSPRIKPMSGITNYGKAPPPAPQVAGFDPSQGP